MTADTLGLPVGQWPGERQSARPVDEAVDGGHGHARVGEYAVPTEAAGSVAGPVGTVIGDAVGAVAGGLDGKGVAEKIDPTSGKTRI